MTRPHRLALLLALAATAVAAAPSAAAVLEPRIIRGEVAPIEALPYTVSIGNVGRSALGGHFCGGSVIAPDAILTAAHCVEGEPARGMLVTSGRTRLSDTAAGQRTRVTAVAVEPRWNGAGHDLAILRLAAPIGAPPVALSAGGVLEAAGAHAVVAGWGLTRSDRTGGIPDGLRAVELPISSAAPCRRAFGRDFDFATMVCAGGDHRDSCNGDSGGPLVASDLSGVVQQIGIVSFGGPRCGQPGVPGVYTRVSAARAWIASIIDAPTEAPGTAQAVVRFGRITCGTGRCRVELRVRNDDGVASLLVRGPRGTAAARRVAPGLWIARIALPYGAYSLSARPLAADGTAAGSPAHVRLRVS